MAIKLEEDSFGVVGIGLQAYGRTRLKAAFPGCRIFGVQPEDQAKAQEQCEVERRTTIFMELPASDDVPLRRVSLLFDQTRVRVIALCGVCSQALCDAAMQLEFSGAIADDSSVDTYRRAAAAVHRGELWFSREYLSKLTRRHLGSSARLELSERETAILALIAEESSNQEIADRLFIARDTVRWHLKSLYAKFGISDRGSARRFARNVLTDCLPGTPLLK